MTNAAEPGEAAGPWQEGNSLHRCPATSPDGAARHRPPHLGWLPCGGPRRAACSPHRAGLGHRRDPRLSAPLLPLHDATEQAGDLGTDVAIAAGTVSGGEGVPDPDMTDGQAGGGQLAAIALRAKPLPPSDAFIPRSVARQPRGGGRVRVLRPMPQQVVGQHAGQHRLAHRHGADADARVVAALGAMSISGPPRSTVWRGVRIEQVGLTANRATMGWPVEMPPRIPPAWLDANHHPVPHAHLVGVSSPAVPRRRSRRRSPRP